MNQRAYLTELFSISNSLPTEKRPEFLAAFLEREKNPVVAFGFNSILGYLGADRFFVGQPVMGCLKLLTLGGFGIWIVVDYFLIGGITRDRNIVEARQIKSSMT